MYQYQFGQQESAQERETAEKLERAEREIKAMRPAAEMWQRDGYLEIVDGDVAIELIAGLNGGYIASAHSIIEGYHKHNPRTFQTTGLSAGEVVEKVLAVIRFANLINPAAAA